jgi:hypothetical protein
MVMVRSQTRQRGTLIGGIPADANPRSNIGRTTYGDFGPGGLIIQSTPCVGQLRVVPDFMSISPQSGQVLIG